jgi:hypothetical protein
MLKPSLLLQEVIARDGLASHSSRIKAGVRNEWAHLLQRAPVCFCSLGKLFGRFALEARETDNVQGHYTVLIVVLQPFAEVDDDN